MERRAKEIMEKTIGCPMTRRKFLQGVLAAGALAAVPGGILLPAQTLAAEGGQQVFRNACPRNCFDTCSIITYVEDGVIRYIEGAPESTFTNGGLCVKGYTYTRRPYHPDRIKYPMEQLGRGSGKWKRLSWDEALSKITKKFMEIKEKDDSMLGLGLTKYSGNFGITNQGVEGMMSSLGYTTRFVGSPCAAAGDDAQTYDMGEVWCNDPEDMVHTRYLILWGVNPAWCSIHSMKYIYAAKESGAKVVCIDPVFTQTAAKSDVHWQVKTGTDSALALGMCRHILDKGLYDQDWVTANSEGFEEFSDYLRSKVTVEWASKESGVPAAQIASVAEEFATAKPASIWFGYGLQRHTNGGVTVRAIDALCAMTGNIGKTGGGARYGQIQTWGFKNHALSQKQPEGARGLRREADPGGESKSSKDEEKEAPYTDRPLNINQTAEEILTADKPPIRVLWVSCKNPISQDFDRNKMLKAFEKLEMVVVVDQFFTQTAEQADIVLPVTTLFEEWTVNVSYWHYWMSINEQAISPMYETKSNLEIAAALSAKMNELSPGSCTFPTRIDPKEWMIKEFNQDIYDLFGIDSWKDLKSGPVKAKARLTAWNDLKFATPSGKYEFKSNLCAEHGHAALPEYQAGRKPDDKLRLLTPHTKFGINSQFINLDWIEEYDPVPFVYLNPKTAAEKGIGEGDLVKVFNKTGQVTIVAKLTDNVPVDCILMYEAWFNKNSYNVQNLVDYVPTDMGKYTNHGPGAAIHDHFADVKRA